MLFDRADEVLAESRNLQRATLVVMRRAVVQQALLTLRWDAEAVLGQIRSLQAAEDGRVALRAAESLRDDARTLLREAWLR